MSKYQDWLLKQEQEFIKLIHKDKIPDNYRNEDIEGISLEDLEKLDNQFINNEKDTPIV